MCIAIVKPKFAEFPTAQQFRNCFTTNPHGAGFMYSNGENLVIKKGFMTFEDFIEAFEKENISKDKLVFFHFRIATHGLIDGGNTHPFPISMDVKEQRNHNSEYKGYGLIHNGVFKYDIKEFIKYDPSGVISDTMLLAMKIKECFNLNQDNIYSIASAIVYNIHHKDMFSQNLIEDNIGYNKVAIMNEKEEYVKYGKWIEDNGVFYSNDDYNFDSEKYSMYYGGCYFNDYDFCICCGEPLELNKYKETNVGDCCLKCFNMYSFKECESCGIYIFQEDDNEITMCEECVEDYLEECSAYNEYCEICGDIKRKDGCSVCSRCAEFIK